MDFLAGIPFPRSIGFFAQREPWLAWMIIIVGAYSTCLALTTILFPILIASKFLFVIDRKHMLFP